MQTLAILLFKTFSSSAEYLLILHFNSFLESLSSIFYDVTQAASSLPTPEWNTSWYCFRCRLFLFYFFFCQAFLSCFQISFQHFLIHAFPIHHQARQRHPVRPIHQSQFDRACETWTHQKVRLSACCFPPDCYIVQILIGHQFSFNGDYMQHKTVFQIGSQVTGAIFVQLVPSEWALQDLSVHHISKSKLNFMNYL